MSAGQVVAARDAQGELDISAVVIVNLVLGLDRELDPKVVIDRMVRVVVEHQVPVNHFDR